MKVGKGKQKTREKREKAEENETPHEGWDPGEGDQVSGVKVSGVTVSGVTVRQEMWLRRWDE